MDITSNQSSQANYETKGHFNLLIGFTDVDRSPFKIKCIFKETANMNEESFNNDLVELARTYLSLLLQCYYVL